MTARFVNLDTHTVEEVSNREYFARIFGHAPKSKEERAAEHQQRIERYIGFIENGNDWGVPPPYLAECRRIIELREQVNGDPMLKRGMAR